MDVNDNNRRTTADSSGGEAGAGKEMVAVDNASQSTVTPPSKQNYKCVDISMELVAEIKNKHDKSNLHYQEALDEDATTTTTPLDETIAPEQGGHADGLQPTPVSSTRKSILPGRSSHGSLATLSGNNNTKGLRWPPSDPQLMKKLIEGPMELPASEASSPQQPTLPGAPNSTPRSESPQNKDSTLTNADTGNTGSAECKITKKTIDFTILDRLKAGKQHKLQQEQRAMEMPASETGQPLSSAQKDKLKDSLDTEAMLQMIMQRLSVVEKRPPVKVIHHHYYA